jgi:hypothetical protein
LRQAGPRLLGEGHDRLAEHQAVLRAAERHRVDADVARDRAERHPERSRRIGETRTVEVDAHAEGVRVVGDGPDLVGRVDRAELGALRDRDRQGLRALLVTPAVGLPVDQVGRQLAVGGRHRQQFEAAQALGRPALVGVDVRGRRADDGGPSRRERLQRGDVGTRPGQDGVDRGPLAERLDDHLGQPRRVGIGPVRADVPAVRVDDRLQHLGVGSRVVVAGERVDRGIVEARHPSILPDRRPSTRQEARGRGQRRDRSSRGAAATPCAM